MDKLEKIIEDSLHNRFSRMSRESHLAKGIAQDIFTALGKMYKVTSLTWKKIRTDTNTQHSVTAERYEAVSPQGEYTVNRTTVEGGNIFWDYHPFNLDDENDSPVLENCKTIKEAEARAEAHHRQRVEKYLTEVQ